MDMPNPADIAGIQRCVGFVNYLSKFVPNLSELCKPLRQLTLSDVQWSWLSHYDKAMKAVKESIAVNITLKYFDSAKVLTLQCDS